LFLTCAVVLGQTQTGTLTNSAENAEREAMLKKLLREAIIEETNANDAAARAMPAIPAPTNVTPAAAVPSNATAVVPAVVPAATTPTVTNPVPTPTSTAAAATNAAGQTVPVPIPVPVPAPTSPTTTVQTPTLNVPPPANVPAAIPTPVQTPPAVVPTPTVTPTVATAPAEEVYEPGQVQFPNMDINTFLDFYAKVVDKTVLRAQLPAVQISLKTQTPLTRKEAIGAFDTVLAMNGITILPVDEKFVKAVPTPSAQLEATKFSTGDGKELGEMDQYVNYVVHLKHVKPSEILPAITPFAKMPGNILTVDSSQMLILRDYASNVKRMLEMIKNVDIEVPLEFDSEVIPIRYAQVQDIASALGSLGGGGTSTTIGTPRSTASPGGVNRPSVGGPGGGGYGGTGGTGTLGATSPFGGAGGVGRPTPAAASLTQRLQGILGAQGQAEFQILGPTKILADERTNSLLVFAGKRDMEIVKRIVKQLDVVLAQVLIEAIIMEVSIDNTRNIGVSYLQNQPSMPGNYISGLGALNNGRYLNRGNFLSTGTNVPALPSGFSYLATFGDDFSASITAIESDGRVRVLARPRVQTSHNEPAILKVGDNVPIVTGTYFGGINASASSQYQLQFVGIELDVTPLVNADGLVVMDIVQDIQQLGTPTVIDGNQVPTTTQRYAKAKVSVKDHDTIILGGFISTSKTKTVSGLPVMKDVPILGALFRSTSDETRQVELIVMMRPTVLPTPESAAIAAAHERDILPGVKAAEAEIQQERVKRMKDAQGIKVPDEGGGK
jgi:general secretion pathway protein D